MEPVTDNKMTDEGKIARVIGEAIKEARIKQHLTQEELGARIGVQRAQICKIERGRHSLTLSTMGKVFRALGFDKATLDLGGGVRLALW